MRGLTRRRPTPALVISLIALIVALGGTGYAALKVPNNSVGSKQIKKGAITTSKLANSAVTESKVKSEQLAVANAQSATHAHLADTATQASHAGTADSAATVNGQHIAYAHVVYLNHAPTIDTSQSTSG